ncbi:MAG: transposase family protein [Planctomycetes bacterium]|nr:transposase family protein [Planctomycetota bacterium]
MAIDDGMTIDERRKYLHHMRKRYLAADRATRGQLLSEMEAVTGLHRKSLIRLLNAGPLQRRTRTTQRGRTYGTQVEEVIRVIAESCDYLCAERLKPNLPWLSQHLAAHGELHLTPTVELQLTTISVSTLRRVLQRIPRDQPRLPRRGPDRAQRMIRGIPMQRLAWDQPQPGYFEVDLVHHCGPSTGGEYVHTLQMVDVATGWSERAAVLGRSFTVLRDAFQRIQARLPFPIRHIHPDNGSEFLNAHMLRFWHQAMPGVQISRSRPYHKNDNRLVEQKNATLVRAYLGQQRLDSVAQTLALNQLYDLMWVYYNFFQPVMHLAAKTALPQPDGQIRYRRQFDRPATPFDRCCAAVGDQSSIALADLHELRQGTNPRQLRRQIYHLLDRLSTLPGATPGDTEDVYQTLCHPNTLKKGQGHSGNIISWQNSLAHQQSG